MNRHSTDKELTHARLIAMQRNQSFLDMLDLQYKDDEAPRADVGYGTHGGRAIDRNYKSRSSKRYNNIRGV